MMNSHVRNKLSESGIVAVMRNMTSETVIETVSALKSAGITAIEITVENGEGMEVVSTVKKHFKDEVLLGAGTVLDGITAKNVIDLGVDFNVIPVVSTVAIQVAKRYGCFIGVGAMTPIEVLIAYEAGADIVKIFLASNLGPTYLKNIKGPLHHIPLMPTEGINLNNLADFVKNGAECIGVGGALYKYDTVEEIKKVAKEEYVNLIVIDYI